MDRKTHTTSALAGLVCLVGIAACTQPTGPHRSPTARTAARSAVSAASEKAHGSSTGLKGTCPASDFRGFLQAYAADPLVRSRYTAKTVAVTEWKNVDETELGTQVVKVPVGSYSGFTLTFNNSGFHHVAADGTVDPATESPSIKSSASGYDVSYVYGMSEGNTWHFSAQGDCWLLTSDPEPSSP